MDAKPTRKKAISQPNSRSAICIFIFSLFDIADVTILSKQPSKATNFDSQFLFSSALQLSSTLRQTNNPTLLAKMNNNNHDENDFDLSEFTKEEKLSWLGGYDLWNLRAVPELTKIERSSNTNSSSNTNTNTKKEFKTSICVSDGPHGVRKPLNNFSLQKAFPASCFPSACSTACSWNPRLLETMGRALALECEHYGVQVLLGPGVNLKRHPCGGRNHEYFSEDPYLAGLLAKSYISGVQESGTVGACLKHFCLNNQESNRFIVDAVVDERTMRELYLPAFEHSLCSEDPQSVPKLVMGAYNKVILGFVQSG